MTRIHSISQKAFMAITGLGMIVFLIAHLTGNTILFKGASAFNGYAKFLTSSSFLILAELGLIATFAIHVWAAIKVTLENRAARPQPYALRQTSGESTLSSRTMFISGILITVFLIFHIWNFKYGPKNTPGGLWSLVVSEFEKPAVLAFYVLGMFGIGSHLGHAVGSMFQTLGMRNSSGRPRLLGLSAGFGWALALCFAALPIAVFILKPNPDVLVTPPAINATTAQPSNSGCPFMDEKSAPASKPDATPKTCPGVSWRTPVEPPCSSAPAARVS